VKLCFHRLVRLHGCALLSTGDNLTFYHYLLGLHDTHLHNSMEYCVIYGRNQQLEIVYITLCVLELVV
jgi:hypothetical protein